MSEVTRRLSFAVGAIAVVACSSDDTDSATVASTANAETTAQGVTAASSAGEASTSGELTSDSAADAEDIGMPCEPDPVPELCRTYAERWVECIYGDDIPPDGIADGCSCFLQLAQEMYGPDCVAALEDYYACIALADCMTIAVGEACLAEGDAIAAICPSLSPS